MPDDGDAPTGGLTEEHHSWISQFFGVSLKAAASAASDVGQVASSAASSVVSTVEQAAEATKQAVTSAVSGAEQTVEQAASDATQAVTKAGGVAGVATKAAHSVEKAVTPPAIGQALDQGIEGAIDKGSDVQKKSIDDLPLPNFLKAAADDVVTIEGGVTKGLVKVGAGLIQGAQDAVDMVDGVDLVKGAAKVTAAIANEDDRKQLLTDAESSIKSLADQGEAIVNPVGALVKGGISVAQGYEKASAEGKALDYVATLGGVAIGTIGLIAAGEGKGPGDVAPPDAPPPDAPPPATPPPEITPPERQLPARGETTRSDPGFDRTKEWTNPNAKNGENLAGLDHISEEHAPWAETSPDKSKFTQDTWNNLKQTIKDAVNKGDSKPFKPMAEGPQQGSVYDYHPGFQTGADARGKPLFGIRVVVDGNNQLVTAFPIK